jgi:hypothetical protein
MFLEQWHNLVGTHCVCLTPDHIEVRSEIIILVEYFVNKRYRSWLPKTFKIFKHMILLLFCSFRTPVWTNISATRHLVFPRLIDSLLFYVLLKNHSLLSWEFEFLWNKSIISSRLTKPWVWVTHDQSSGFLSFVGTNFYFVSTNYFVVTHFISWPRIFKTNLNHVLYITATVSLW